MSYPEVLAGVDDVVPLAAAIARRQVDESLRAQAVMAEVVGRDQEGIDPELQAAVATGSTALVLKRLHNPEVAFGAAEIVNEVFDDETLDLIVTSVGEDPDEDIRELLRGHIHGQIELTMTLFGGDNDPTVKLRGELAAAAVVAEAAGVPVETVYETDELYEAMNREAQDPVEFITAGLGQVDRVNDELLREMVANLLRTSLREEFRGDGALPEDEFQALFEEEMADFEANEEAMADVHQAIVDIKRAGKIIVRRQLERFWGDGALSLLPEELVVRLTD